MGDGSSGPNCTRCGFLLLLVSLSEARLCLGSFTPYPPGLGGLAVWVASSPHMTPQHPRERVFSWSAFLDIQYHV